jgi:hypothetical protein
MPTGLLRRTCPARKGVAITTPSRIRCHGHLEISAGAPGREAACGSVMRKGGGRVDSDGADSLDATDSG